MKPDASKEISIADKGRLCRLDYEGLLAYHGGGAVFGAALGFRMLQLAGSILSQQRLWDRDRVHVTSAHPGPGVRDAIEYVTRCVTRGRFKLRAKDPDPHCGTDVDYLWEVSDGAWCVSVELLPGIVPSRFLELADIARSGSATTKERRELEEMKIELAESLWLKSLDGLFRNSVGSVQNK